MFYHHKRKDGGVRTGVEVNDGRVLETFLPGEGERDAALLYFVDVRCSGAKLPQAPEEVRVWLLEHSTQIKSALKALADDLSAGIDIDWPAKKEAETNGSARIAVYCSAMRRLSGREIASILLELETNWHETIKGLQLIDEAVHA
jgi:hypothetical protein